MLLAAVAALQGCSYSYPIWATMVGGRLAFESGDRAHDCFTNIRVSATGPLAPDPAIAAIADPMERGRAEERARAAWMTDAIATYECKGHFPVVYGAPMPGITIVAARPLRIGVAYEVSTYGPKGSGGHGCFRINPDRRPENLAGNDCSYAALPPPPPPPPVEPVAAPAQPPAATPSGQASISAPEPRIGQGAGAPGGMAVNVSSPPAVVVQGSSLPAQPIDARPPPESTGPSQMYALTPYRGIERYLRDYPSLAACERARAQMEREEAERRLCGFGPRRPLY